MCRIGFVRIFKLKNVFHCKKKKVPHKKYSWTSKLHIHFDSDGQIAKKSELKTMLIFGHQFTNIIVAFKKILKFTYYHD